MASVSAGGIGLACRHSTGGIAKSAGYESPLTPRHMQMLDVARLFAAIGIIILHIASLDKETAYLVHLGRFAVPFFTIAAVALTVYSSGNNPTKSLLAYMGSRILRIYVPFLFWTFTYIAFRDFKYRFVTNQPLVPLNWPLLVVGSAHHLWFLPFILMATFGAAVAAKYFLFRLPTSVVIPISLGLALAAFCVPTSELHISPVSDGDGLTFQYFMSLAWRALPMAFVGVGLGRAWRELCSLPYIATLAWMGLLVAVLSLALMPTFNDSLVL